jgi:Phosphodiester glycosidase
VDGLNRKPGLILNCGGVDDEPFDRPAHDHVCRDADEIVVTPAFGETADAGAGFQVTLDRGGVVTARQDERGGPIPEDGVVVQATGESASWLSDHAPPGSRLRISRELRDERGRRVRLTPRTDMVNGGPTLVQRGRVVLDPVREGWSPEDIESTDRGGFYNGWYLRRNPRTAAAIGHDGTLLLVTVDGRQPGYSIGTSIRETARLMEHLGSRAAVNLDGGGSTTMVVHGGLQGRPSDPTGERAMGDALVLLPRSKGANP